MSESVSQSSRMGDTVSEICGVHMPSFMMSSFREKTGRKPAERSFLKPHNARARPLIPIHVEIFEPRNATC